MIELHGKFVTFEGREYPALLPTTELGKKQIERIIEKGRLVEAKVASQRQHDNNAHHWSLISFIWANMPERFCIENVVDKTMIPIWRSKESFHYWLAEVVGWTERFTVNGKVYVRPRPTNFDDEKNEIEVENGYYLPARKYMAEMMDMETKDFVDSAIAYAQWIKGKG